MGMRRRLTGGAAAARPLGWPRVRTSVLGAVPEMGVDFCGVEELRCSAFGRTVAELCLRHDLSCVVRLDRQVAAAPEATTNVVSGRIVVSRAVLAESDEEQAWTAAHEVGHLVDARTQGLRCYLPWRYYGWCLAAVAAVTVTVPLVTVLPVAQQPVPVRWGIAVVVVVAGLVGLGVCGRLALLRLASHKRPQEDSADMFATSQGFPVTVAIAEMLDRQERRADGRPPSRRWQRYRHHRYPYERITTTTVTGAVSTPAAQPEDGQRG